MPDDCTGVVNPRCTIDPSHSDGIQSLVINGSTLFSGARDMGIMKWDISETPQIKQVSGTSLSNNQMNSFNICFFE